MNPLAIRAALGLLLSFGVTAFADPAHDGRHEPPTTHPEADHAHPDVDLHHAIVTDTPVPETELRLGYSFLRPGSGSAHELSASLEYAFTTNFSIELTAPWTLLDAENAGPRGRFGDVEISAKLASYRFVDQHLLPAIGVSLSLPTGNDDFGVGSNHVVGVEPFLRVGYWQGPLQLVGTLNVGVPLNRRSFEQGDADFEIAYNLAAIYELSESVQALVEVNGVRSFGGGGSSTHALYISPGVTFQPFTDKSINFGIGVSLPVTDHREFDFAVNAFMILHI